MATTFSFTSTGATTYDISYQIAWHSNALLSQQSSVEVDGVAKVFGTEGSVTKSSSVSCLFPGNKAAVGSDFKSLDDLKKEDGEATIVSWIKAGIMDYKVAKVQKAMLAIKKRDKEDEARYQAKKKKEEEAEEAEKKAL